MLEDENIQKEFAERRISRQKVTNQGKLKGLINWDITDRSGIRVHSCPFLY